MLANTSRVNSFVTYHPFMFLYFKEVFDNTAPYTEVKMFGGSYAQLYAFILHFIKQVFTLSVVPRLPCGAII